MPAETSPADTPPPSTAPAASRRARWVAFWSRGGLWRALLFAAGYIAFFLLASQVIAALFGDQIDTDDVFSSAGSIFWGLAAPIVLGGILLVVFVRSVGWARELFGPQPIRGRPWMWIAPVVVLAFDVLRFAAVDYTAYTTATVVATLLLGLCIGFVEELLTRGIAVDLLRRGGYGEWAVMMLSSLLFALLHSVNVLAGIDVATVVLTVVYTFTFGVAMYLTLRVTGNIIWPMLLHALTDPSGILLSGGVDVSTDRGEVDGLAALAAAGNLVVVLMGLVLLLFVRGRVDR
ncbi:MAG: type II CAAX endopeptidase family protein, partial [Brevundimonas sp.]